LSIYSGILPTNPHDHQDVAQLPYTCRKSNPGQHPDGHTRKPTGRTNLPGRAYASPDAYSPHQGKH